MIEIYFKKRKIFEFEDVNAIQLIGKNKVQISLIVEIYDRVLNNYKFKDIDMEGMDGYYPEIVKDGQTLKGKDIDLLRLSNMSDFIGQLTTNKNSVLIKNISSYKNDISVNQALVEIEEKFINLSILMDELIKGKIETENIIVKSDIVNMNFDNILKNFIDINFQKTNNQKVPAWLLSEEEMVDLFIELIEISLETEKITTLIVDKMDSKMGISNYKVLLSKLYNLTKENSNFNIWIIPSIKEGVLLEYDIFKNTYILNEEIIKLGDFAITYESICRNYPDNNMPTEKEVLKALLQVLPFHNNDNCYYPTREIVVASIFSKLQGNLDDFKLDFSRISSLEENFLLDLS